MYDALHLVDQIRAKASALVAQGMDEGTAFDTVWRQYQESRKIAQELAAVAAARDAERYKKQHEKEVAAALSAHRTKFYPHLGIVDYYED